MSIIIDTPLRNISSKITSRFIGSGYINVDFPDKWYLQDSDGDFVTDERDEKIFLGFPGYPLLDQYGEPMLDTNGDWLIQTDHSPHGLGGYISPYQLDSDGEFLLDSQQDAFPYYQTPLLDTNWRALLVDGIATSLDTLETTIQYVTIQARFTNLGKIWIGNSSVSRDRGIYLDPNHPSVTLNIDDLRKIYIIGNAGEGVTFLYGTNEDIFLTTPGGDFVTTPGGDQIDV